MARIGSNDPEPETDIGTFDPTKRIIENKKKFRNQLMILAEGNMQEYETLKRTSCENFLLKLENYIERALEIEKQLAKIKIK